MSSAFASHRPLGGVRFNALRPQVPGKFAPPFAQGRLPDVQPYTFLADGLYDRVNMRMRFIGVKYERISMAQREFLPQKVSGGGQHRLRRRSCRHAEHQLVDKLWRPATPDSCEIGLTPMFVKVQIPILHERSSNPLSLTAMPVVILHGKLSISTDVPEMSSDGTEIIGVSWEYLYYCFGRAPDGSRNLRELTR